MHISTCERPEYILNKYTDEVVSCHCGKCPSCMNAKAKRWIQRLDDETQCHKYAFLITLTYDNENLPKLGLSDSLDSLVSFGRSDIDLCIPFEELEFSNDAERVLLQERLEHPLGLPFYYPKDFSRFFKRLNKYFYDKVTGKYENFRYFLCGELGPSTHRAHAHGVVWFDDERISKCFAKALSSCWTYGDSMSDAIYSTGASSYVAQYVNLSLHLPAFYNHPKLRQRCQFSKCPAIGSIKLLDEEIQTIYDTLPIGRTVYSPHSGKFVFVPIFNALKSRLFPKCLSYSTLSYPDRVRLYGICNEIPSQDFEEFKYSTDLLFWLNDRKISNKTERFLGDFLYQKKKESELYHTSFNDTLRRVYAVSKRVCMFANMLNTSVAWIVRRIDEFYKKLDYQNLYEFYSFQQDYSKSHSVHELSFMYPNFVFQWEFYKRNPRVNFDYIFQMAFESFGLDKVECCELQDCAEFKTMVHKAQKIFKESHKSHDVHDYLYSRRMSQVDPQLQKILIKYFKNCS